MIWDFLQRVFSSGTDTASSMDDVGSTVFNPATGLPMLDASTWGVDVGGSPYGIDVHACSNAIGSVPGSPHWD